jgi:Tfp pilus assembly protein PilF
MPESSPQSGHRPPARLIWTGAVLILVVLIGTYVSRHRQAGLLSPGSAEYEQTTSRFYRGLAGLQVGLLEQARDEFTVATTLASSEPAVWANLGLTHLRLGEFDAAAVAIGRAVQLAPSHPALAFLEGRLEVARGRRDEGIVQLRRAVALDPSNLHARTALIQEIENAGAADADAEAQRLLEEVLTQEPDNVAVLVERARLSAKRADMDRLRDSVARLDRFAAAWPAEVTEQYRAVQEAVNAADAPAAARSVAFLRNVLARVPAFLESRRRVTPSAELIAEPLPTFISLPAPEPTPAPPDLGLTFTRDAVGAARTEPWQALAAVELDGDAPPLLVAADAQELRRLDREGALATAPQSSGASVRALLPLDWNHDFRMDLLTAGAGGVRLWLQSAAGSFSEVTAQASANDGGAAALEVVGAWAADVEMDGDLDAVLGVAGGEPIVLRNNGDGTWRSSRPFPGVVAMRAFVWGDLDADGDPDAAALDGAGTLHVLANLQAGQFQRLAGPPTRTDLGALGLGDVDADGRLDLLTLDGGGVIRRATLATDGWFEEQIAGNAPGALRLLLEDLDNNGAVDLVASGPTASMVWLAGSDRILRASGLTIDADIRSIADLNGDGQLDLAGLASGQAVRFLGRGTLGYHFQVVRPRAQAAAGDQRINSFGIGGEIEVRSGPLVQKQLITAPVVHFGLGRRTAIDVARIIWPNGVPQAEFDPAIDRALVAEQRLKGSCPWIFADDGTGMRFVTDFLWRSPLGLRINAQDTAGVLQTEDWVRIRGDQLVARNGVYDVRMSAELWETHFVDHVSLMVVDHPADVEVFVDERFAPASPPRLALHAMRTPRPIVRARDQDGQDVTGVVRVRDGRHLGTFARGKYQGVATDHFVEVELDAPIPADGQTWLVGHGWVYPTDSSINVAMGQGSHVPPRSLSLEAAGRDGTWTVVATDLGFPAGKNKTVLIDLGRVAEAGIVGATRLRLRTNLEIYWDALAVAAGVPDAPLRTRRVAPATADLRYRGFSQTVLGPREQPETPVYDRIATTTPRWRNLVGYYTRFGDVRALLERVEDRYLIMNAGDELRMSFPAPAAPPAGWARDFVLIGDGWVKDGDYNTSYAKTVLPLPTHASPDYAAARTEPVLEDDPIYQRHRDDWQTFHTRYVTAREFIDGLRFPAPAMWARAARTATVSKAGADAAERP